MSRKSLLKNLINVALWATKKASGLDIFLDIFMPKKRKNSKKREFRLDEVQDRTKKVLTHNIADNFIPGAGFILDKLDPIFAPKKQKNYNINSNLSNMIYVKGYYRKNGSYVNSHYKRR